MGMMLLIVAAAALAAAAAGSPKKPADKTGLKVVTPGPAKRERRKKIIRRAMTDKEKKAVDKIQSSTVNVATQTGKEVVKSLVAIATSKKTHHHQVRRAAKKKLGEIAKQNPDAVKDLPAKSKIDIAQSIVTADTTTPPTPAQAAQALQIYTKEGGNQGSTANRSEMVRGSQQLMGEVADGIIGPKTRTRAAALGYSLYSREYEKLPDGMTPAQAAGFLLEYTKEGGNQGSRANPSKQVARAQQLMGAAPFDGIIGSGTRAKAQSLGFPLYGRSYQTTTV